VEALTDSDGKQANTITEKEDMLKPESLPQDEDNKYFKLPPAGQAQQSVTEQAVLRAPFVMSIRKAPGQDKPTSRAVRMLTQWATKQIEEQAEPVVRTGQHIDVRKWARGVGIWKPGKDDYAQLQAHCSISLLICMVKVVEKVVAELPAEKAERRGVLSDGQYGSRTRRSAIDTAAIMFDRAHPAWRHGHISGVLLLDIKAAFLSVWRGRLIHTIRDKGMDGDRMQWTASLLTDRTVTMVLEGNVMERHPVEAGIPQGSPVSVILFAIYTSGLIKRVEERVTRGEGLSFVDDIGLVATGNDLNQVIRRHEACARVSINLAER